MHATDPAAPATSRTVLTRRRLLMLSGAVMLTPLLAACQQPAPAASPAKPAESKPAESKPAQAAPAVTSAPAAAAPPKPVEAAKPAEAAKPVAAAKPSGTLVMATNTEVGPLENSLNLGGDTQRCLLDVYDRLVQEDLSVDSPIPPLVPSLATAWTSTPDGSAWTFTLRQGVTFHDGSPFNADAVKFNIERLTKPDHEFYFERGAGATKIVYGNIASVDVVDPHTVRMNMSKPYSNLPDALSLPIASMANPAVIKQYGNNDHPAHASGTGPYKFVSQEKGVKLVLEANPNYWGGPVPLQQIIIRPIAETTAAASALLSGEIQMFATRDSDAVEPLRSNAGLEFKTANMPLSNPWIFNLAEKPFDDKRVRQALNWAVDRETYAKTILKGLAQPSKSVFGPSMAAFDPALAGYTYNPDKAKALLAEAGFPNGFSFKMATARSNGLDQLALYVKDNLAKIAVNVEVELFEANTFAANANKDGIKPGIGALGWSWIGNPPFNFDRFFTAAFAPPNGANWGAYKSDKVEELLAQVGKTSDREERLKLYRQLDAQIVEDAPWLFLMHPGEVRVSSKKLTWVSANATFFTLRNASMA